MIEQLKMKFGTKCSAIGVNKEWTGTFQQPSKPLKFCEAVNYSFQESVKLGKQDIGCRGARRSLGFDNDDSALARFISSNNNIPVQFIENALREIPKLKNINNVFLGIDEDMEKKIEPDLYIIYVQPLMVTKLIHNLAKIGIRPFVSSFSLLSVCGNIFSHCYKNNTVSLSFGCPESRKYGGIEKNEVVLGFSSEYALNVISSA
jgi:uncharacterized protein (DUF169 family)